MEDSGKRKLVLGAGVKNLEVSFGHVKFEMFLDTCVAMSSNTSIWSVEV